MWDGGTSTCALPLKRMMRVHRFIAAATNPIICVRHHDRRSAGTLSGPARPSSHFSMEDGPKLAVAELFRRPLRQAHKRCYCAFSLLFCHLEILKNTSRESRVIKGNVHRILFFFKINKSRGNKLADYFHFHGILLIV